MVESLLEKAFDSFKKITPALVAVAILSGSLLFLPEAILKKMSLNDLPNQWKRIIGILFLLCVSLIATILMFSIGAKIVAKRRNKRIKDNLKKRLKALSQRQKAIIIKLLKSDDKTILLDKNSGDTIYLENNLFLHMPQQVFAMGWDNEMKLRYVPQPWLLELYNEEPELFE